MTSITELEASVQRLRSCLRQQHISPLHKLLCGLQHFALLQSEDETAWYAALLESGLREFASEITRQLALIEPGELLPGELDQLEQLLYLMDEHHALNFEHCTREARDFLSAERSSLRTIVTSQERDGVSLAALIVEYNPELRLQPRGRLLKLHVAAEPLRRQAGEDKPFVHNPTLLPRDEFGQQAQWATRLARDYLTKRYGLNPRRRFRVEFHIEGDVSTITGPSLGLAMTAGATVAIAKAETLRFALSLPSDSALSGAVTPDGQLDLIDGQGLRLKIIRAAHAGVRRIVVPREHLAEAIQFVDDIELDPRQPRLELVPADNVTTVLDDKNLVFPQKRSRIAFEILRLRRRVQEPRVGIPVLLLSFLLMLLELSAPYLDRDPYRLSWERNECVVQNASGKRLWSVWFPCDSVHSVPPGTLVDLDGDDRKEVILLPRSHTLEQYPTRLLVYQSGFLSLQGRQLWQRDPIIWGEYPGDSVPGLLYRPQLVECVEINGTKVIVTAVAQDDPARSHVRFWSKDGDSLGWFVLPGAGAKCATFDYSGDGHDELLLLSINNRIGRCGIALVDPIGAFGVIPPFADPIYDLSRVTRGNFIRYMTLPNSDVTQVEGKKYLNPDRFELESDGLIRADLHEHSCLTCKINFYLDLSFRVVRVDVNDIFAPHRDRLVSEGRLDPVDWKSYRQALADSVLYWTPAGWAREP